MYMTYILETILTSVLFLSRVRSRPTDVMCDGMRQEGDKWFDGCRWCMCEKSRAVCSSSECSVIAAQLPPCQNVGDSWADGCYACKCLTSGIECSLDQACVPLMKAEQFGTYITSREACMSTKDDRCICGIDGVPSCTATVIDKNAYPAITIELFPTPSSSASSSSQQKKIPQQTHTNLKFVNKAGHVSDSRNGHYENGRSLEEASSLPASTGTNQLHQQRSHSIKHTSGTMQSKNSTKAYNDYYASEIASTEDPVSYRLNYNLDKPHSRDQSEYVTINNRNDNSKDYSLSQRRHSFRDLFEKNNSDEREVSSTWNTHTSVGYNSVIDERLDNGNLGTANVHDQAAGDGVAPSLLVVSVNRCRWGARWYGGSLRCYCGTDNSITCGDASFVATRIDGFRLKKAVCKQGQTQDDDDPCTICECQMNGIMLCTRSPSCPLPFLIKPLQTGDNNYDIDTDHSDIQKEFTGTDEHKILWNGTGDTIDSKRPQKEETLSPVEVEAITVHDSEAVHIPQTGESSSVYNETDYNYIYGDEEGSGESMQVTHTAASLDTGNDITDITETRTTVNEFTESTSPTYTSDSKANNDNGSNHPEVETLEVNNEKNDSLSEITAQELTFGNKVRNESVTFAKVTAMECKPKSRWIDGCKRCKCDTIGKKYCDDSRCPKVVTASVETPKYSSNIEDKPSVRPVQRPPNIFPPIRDHPVEIHKTITSSASCGQYKPGDMYWDDCNACLCTSYGPKCTAKNCT